MNSTNKKPPTANRIIPAVKHRVGVANEPVNAARQFAPAVAQPKRSGVTAAKPPVVQAKKTIPPVKKNAFAPIVRNSNASPVQRSQTPRSGVQPILQTKKAVTPPPAKPLYKQLAGRHVVQHKPISPAQQAIQRKTFVSPRSGVIQPKYAPGSYVTVRSESGDWYGEVKKLLPTGYRVRIGGGQDDDTVDVAEQIVHPHPSFAARYEVHRDNVSVDTVGGTWRARKYNSVMGRVDPSVRGAYIELEFLPNESVDATRIVLIQTVKAVKDGASYYVNDGTDWVRTRSVNGISIDQMPRSVSPEYAANPKASPLEFGYAFGGAPVQDQAGGHGSRINSHPQPAWLRDKPHLRDVSGLSSQEFETTAVAADGPDKGKYYGSVSWGWIWRGSGERVELFPLEVVSYGAVSGRFVEAAKKWNSVLTSGFVDPIKIPLPKH